MIEKTIKVVADDLELKTYYGTHYLFKGEVKRVRFKNKNTFRDLLDRNNFVEASKGDVEGKEIPVVLPDDVENTEDEVEVEEISKGTENVASETEESNTDNSEDMEDHSEVEEAHTETSEPVEETLAGPVSEEPMNGITVGQGEDVVEEKETHNVAETPDENSDRDRADQEDIERAEQEVIPFEDRI